MYRLVNMKNSCFGFFYVFLALFLLSCFPTVSADRGMIPIEPTVSVYEPGQKAVVAWNGQEEILILSTDVTANGGTWVLEMMPLPSNPTVIEKASFESFVTIQELIWTYAPEVLGRYYGGAEQTESVEVVFHEKIGAHDIIVVNASNAPNLIQWIESFLEANEISREISLQNFESVIEDYLTRGFCYFVLDLIDLSSEQRSVEPILYRFETHFIYYPLKISSPINGNTKITLFVLTKGRIGGGFFFIPYYPLSVAYYQSRTYRRPIQLNLTRSELATIDLRIDELFEDNAWLTVLEYEGPLNGLKRDLMITESGVSILDYIHLGRIVVYLLLGLVVGTLCSAVVVTFLYLTTRVKRVEK